MSSGEKVLIVAPGCPTCDKVKARLREKGVLQRFRVVDVSTPEGKDFAMKLGVKGVPDCAVIEGRGNQKVVRVCSDGEWKRMLEGE